MTAASRNSLGVTENNIFGLFVNPAFPTDS